MVKYIVKYTRTSDGRRFANNRVFHIKTQAQTHANFLNEPGPDGKKTMKNARVSKIQK